MLAFREEVGGEESSKWLPDSLMPPLTDQWIKVSSNKVLPATKPGKALGERAFRTQSTVDSDNQLTEVKWVMFPSLDQVSRACIRFTWYHRL